MPKRTKTILDNRSSRRTISNTSRTSRRTNWCTNTDNRIPNKHNSNLRFPIHWFPDRHTTNHSTSSILNSPKLTKGFRNISLISFTKLNFSTLYLNLYILPSINNLSIPIPTILNGNILHPKLLALIIPGQILVLS